MYTNILRMSTILMALVPWCLSGGPVAAYEREYFLSESNQLEVKRDNVKELEEEMKREHLVLLGMTLGETTLSEVKQRFGPAEQISVGHDGVLICYRSVQPDDNSMVVFGADTHGDQRLFNFQLIAGQQPFKGKEQCAPSLLASKEAATKSGLKLGLDAGTVKKIWDAPMMEKNGHLHLYYSYQKATMYGERQGCLIVFSSSVTRFVEDKLAWLLISQGSEGYLGPCIAENNSPTSR